MLHRIGHVCGAAGAILYGLRLLSRLTRWSFNMRERRCASLAFAAFCRCVHLARMRVSWRMPMLTRRSVGGSKSFAFVLLPLVLDF